MSIPHFAALWIPAIRSTSFLFVAIDQGMERS